MGLIKPGIWNQQSEDSDELHRAVTTHHSHCRRSPLAARTAALLHRLRASPPEQAQPGAGDPAAGVTERQSVEDADLNRIQLTGVLGSEPLLYDVGDHPVAALALACQRRWRTPSGAVQLATIWFNLSAWEELAEQCGRQLHRGDRVYVEGYLHLWTETRPPQSYPCHTIVLERIVLLAAGGDAAESQDVRP
jgi:single stranded DNA-binding protein